MPNQATVPLVNRKPDDDLGPLPEGWEERVHSDGRIFFIDHSENRARLLTVFKIVTNVFE
jgi:hypothetical protein